MKHDYEIVYENIVLKPLTSEYIEYLRNWRNDKKNTKYLRKIPYITSEMQMSWFEKYLENNDEMCFVILENCDLNRIVGSASLYNFKDDSVEFGKILIGDEEAHGRKIGLNTLKALCGFAFDNLKMNKVVLECHADNAAAYKVYERAGFEVVGKHPFEGGGEELEMEIRRIREN